MLCPICLRPLKKKAIYQYCRECKIHFTDSELKILWKTRILLREIKDIEELMKLIYETMRQGYEEGFQDGIDAGQGGAY